MNTRKPKSVAAASAEQFGRVNQLLHRFQAYKVERTLSPEDYDVKPAIAVGQKLLEAIEALPPVTVLLVDATSCVMEVPRLVFSRTDISAVLINTFRLDNRLADAADARRIVPLDLVESLTAAQRNENEP